jgi:hypothetical protein
MNIYEAAEAVKEHVLHTTGPIVCTTVGIYGIHPNGTLLRFHGTQDAIRSNAGQGFLFRVKCRDGKADVTLIDQPKESQ